MFDNFQNEKKIVKNSEFFKKKDVEIKKNIIIEKKSEISDFNKNQIEYNSEICNDLSELKFGELLGEGTYNTNLEIKIY